MNIVFVCDTLGSGGAERVISTLSNEFVARGHSTTIIVLSKYAGVPFYSLNEKITTIFLTKNIPNKLGYFKKAKLLRNEILKITPDIVISFLSYVCIYTWWALKSTKIPYIVSERNDPNHRNIIRQFLLNISFAKAAGCVFQTEDAFNYYKNIKKNKKTIIYNPVSITTVDASVYNYGKKVILYVGRLEKQKNPFLLIKAFSLFHNNHPDYILKMYGDGSLKEEILNFVNDNSLTNIVLCGNSKTWKTDEQNASMFVMPSDYEGLPNSLLEALCLGIPSVSTNCSIGGPKEIKKFFPELELCVCNNLDSLLVSMEKSVHKKNCKSRVPLPFQINIIADQWLAFINNVLSHCHRLQK